MTEIIGPRGVVKTTMVLQYIKKHLDTRKVLYESAHELYFYEHRLFELSDNFYKNAGEHLFIVEIHKFPDWSWEHGAPSRGV